MLKQTRPALKWRWKMATTTTENEASKWAGGVVVGLWKTRSVREGQFKGKASQRRKNNVFDFAFNGQRDLGQSKGIGHRTICLL